MTPELDAQHRAQLAETLETVVADLNNRGAISDGYGWEEIAGGLAPLVAEWLADAKGAAVRSMAHLFRDMAQETLSRREVITLLDLRADSYRGGHS